MKINVREIAEKIVEKINETDNDYDGIESIEGYLKLLVYKHNFKLTKENCKWVNGWDFYGHMGLTKWPGNQEDWNNTLLTKINGVSTQIHKNTLRGGATHIQIHPYTLKLFKSIVYFDENNFMLGDRYQIIVNSETPLGLIFIYNKEVFDLNFMPQIVDKEAPELSEISLKFISEFTEEEIVEYKSKLCGCIEVKYGETLFGEEIMANATT